MDVRLTWPDRIDCWDTPPMVDRIGRASVYVKDGKLMLGCDTAGNAMLLDLSDLPAPWDLHGYLAYAGEAVGLLRLDVDGDVIWQAGDDAAIDGGGGAVW